MVTYDNNVEHPSISRINKLREQMSGAGIDFVIIYTADPHLSEYISDTDKTREYFSGFTGSAGTLLVSMEDAVLWTDSRYYVQAEHELKNSNIRLMKDGLKGVPSVSEYIASAVWNGQCIGIDYRTISSNAYELLRKKLPDDVEIVDAISVISKSFEDRKKREFNEITILDEELCGDSSANKIAKVRELIIKKNSFIEESYTYIISDLTSIMWLLNIRGCDVEYVQVAFSYLLIDNNYASVFINKKAITSELKDKLLEAGVSIKEYGTFYNELLELATDYVIFDKSKTNEAINQKASSYCEVIECNDYDFIKKYIKNDREIEGFLDAHIIDGAIMCSFINRIKKLVNENSIDEYEAGKLLDSMRLENKHVKSLSFETICAYKENGAIVHYSAEKGTSKKLAPNSLLLVDSGAHYEMGTTDITRTIVLGELTAEEKKCYTLVLKANLAILDAMFNSFTRADNIDILARDIIWRGGYDYGHGTGHGIGCRLSVHEDPVRISYRSAEKINLEVGVIVSDEPGIYIENEFGIRLENALCVVNDETKNGFLKFKSLTLVPFEMDAIDTSMLSDNEKNVLNAYNKEVYDKISPYLDGDELEYLVKNTTMIQ